MSKNIIVVNIKNTDYSCRLYYIVVLFITSSGYNNNH